MSYLVLARKWRPKDFSETVGQEHVLRALINALDNDRLHHAFLFAGTRGVGKTTIARILAKALNCEKGVTSTPCGECGACQEIDDGRFVDLLEVDAASRTRVDDTRELLDNVQYSPTRGRYKVYLIDEVHMLSTHSFNALLKTLEEPPPHVKFLLATTDPQKLPVTVLSRCLQFNLKRLPLAQIEGRLAQIMEAEKIGAEPAALRQIGLAAEGSMRDALSLLDQAIAYGGGKLLETDVRTMLGSIDHQHTEALVKALARGDAPGLLEAAGRLDDDAPDYGSVLEAIASLLQRVALMQVVPEAISPEEGDHELLAELAAAFSREDVQLYYQIALVGRGDLRLSPDQRSGFEMVLLRMLAFRPVSNEPGHAGGGGSSRPAGSGMSAAPAGISSAPRSAAPVPAAAPAANPKPAGGNGAVAATVAPADGDAVASPENIDLTPANWTKVVASLGLQGAAGRLAANCTFEKRSEGSIFLRLDAAHEVLLTPQQQDHLQTALSQRLGAVKVRIEIGKPQAETPARRDQRKEQERRRQTRDAVVADPNVQALRDSFGATLHEDTIEANNGDDSRPTQH